MSEDIPRGTLSLVEIDGMLVAIMNVGGDLTRCKLDWSNRQWLTNQLRALPAAKR